MITASQALLIALAAAVHHVGTPFVGSALVLPKDGLFEVVLIEAQRCDAGRHEPAKALVVIDKSSGAVVSVIDGKSDPRRFDEVPEVTLAGQLPAAEALEKAVAALQGLDGYAPDGRLTVILKSDHYEVTFPQPPRPAGSLGGDFAYQIWIDAKSGATTKALAAS